VKSKVDKIDCVEYESCKEYVMKNLDQYNEDLCCEVCGHYQPDDCFEDFEGRQPFFSKVRNWKG